MMSKLNYLKTYDEFQPSMMINEGLNDLGQKSINRAFLNMGPIPLSNGESINPRDIIKVVGDAILWLGSEFRTYYSFARDANIIYCVNVPDCTTMAVDQYMNMYMDVLFIYRDLQMNPQYVATIIMHEIFHVIYNHIERGKNWLSANGRPITDFMDTNIAGDIEVNTTLVNKNIIEASTLVNDLHGLYLSRKNGVKSNLTMEAILENDELMNKLRGEVKGPTDTRDYVDTSKEWDEGYKEGWDKIADLIDKYGAEETFKKLQDAGIIDSNGQIINDNVDDILNMNYLIVKSFDEFIFENKNEKTQNLFKSYDDGFMMGVQKAITMLSNALSDGDTPNGGGGNNNNQPVPKSGLKKDDLKKLNLPKKEKENNTSGKPQLPDNLPTNVDDGKPSYNDDQTQHGESQNNGDLDNNEGGENQSSDQGNGGKQQSKDGQQKGQKGEGGSGGDESQDRQEGNGQSSGQDSDSNGQSNDSQNGDGAGSGSQSNQEASADDVNKLANDLKNKKNSKQKGGGSDTSYAEKPKSKGSDPNSIGDTGSFIDDPDSNFAKKVLKNSGYSDEDIDKIINDTIEKNKRLNTPEGIKEKRKKLYSQLSSSDSVKKLLDEIEVSEAKFQNIWKKVMKKFLGQNCRRAGKDKRSQSFDWKNRRALSMHRLAPNFHKEEQEPQNINMYVDVSGSMNEDLLEVISKSLSIFCNQYEYTGINVIPWASTSNGIHAVESIKKSSPEKVAKEILGYISEGSAQCGGGTDLIKAFLPEIIAISNDKKRKKKDDKHVIITDGETFGDEKKIESLITKHCGAIVSKNCFWMIYDPSGSVKESWESSIKIGTLLFINSQIVIANG